MARNNSSNQDATQQEAESNDSADKGLSRFEIEKLAYELWKNRGEGHGSPQQDWFLAEQQLASRKTLPNKS